MEFFEEIKIHKNKKTQHFPCRLLYRTEAHLILLYHSADEANIADIIIPAGCLTIAHYWTDRGYVLWRMLNTEGNPIGSLFHICRDTIISSDRVIYHDLIIDIWVDPKGCVRVLDEDEFEACNEAGMLTADELKWVKKQQKIVLNHFDTILTEAIDLEKRIQHPCF